MALPLEQVVKQLTDSGIIAPGKLEPFIPPNADPKTVDELVQALVKSENLTAFQGQQVKGGKAKSLILGEYTILEKIGAGGMGQVFKARHRRMERTVAIKMLPPSMTKDAAAAARFQREVVAAAKLSHPNIVHANDAGQAGAAHFLVMEYVEGKDLSALVKQNGPFPVNKAVNYILQAARGLEFAHKKGVVHRDIKPANLLLDNEGVVKILDMGLARLDSSVGAESGPQADLTGTGTIMGTVDYMAPEQALDTKHADARADIYSLGISLYFLLSGRAAFEGDTVMKKLLAHREHPIPSLQDTQTTVSKQLDAVFRKMVAKRVEDRYQNMSEVVEALERLGFGGSSKIGMADIASTIDLSSADKKKLAKATKKPLGSITEVVASEKTKHLVLKIVGGSFGTIIAPILVFYLIRHLEKEDKPANPPAANVPAATVPPVVVATNTTTQPPAHVLDDGSPKPLVAPFDAEAAHAGQEAWAKHLGTTVEKTNPVGMTLVLIPPGEFLMGSTDEQVAAVLKVAEEVKVDQPTKDRIQKGERPQHRVVITKPLLMSSTEATVGQFRKFVEATKYVTEAERYGFGDSGDNALSDKVPAKSRGLNWKSPGYAVTDDSPVAQVTWNDACAYCAWLSQQEQRPPWYRPDGKGGWLIAAKASGYRLPTEAEWEYACRAGTTTQYSFGDDYAELEQYGWYSKNAGGKSQPVGLKLPNPFGLFDMHGNLQEWCQDFYDENWYEKPLPNDPKGPSSRSNRVLRGGSWNSASFCRSAYRFSNTPSYRYYLNGFRCVRVADAVGDSQLATNTTTQPTTPVTPFTTQPNQHWNTPAFQQWMKSVAALPAEKQVDAVSKKLMELNPGFDGRVTSVDGKGTPKIDTGVVTELMFLTDNVSDISPVRALVGLRLLTCNGSGPRGNGELSDLSPLHGMKLEKLTCSNNRNLSDLSPLQGIPLIDLGFGGTSVSDLSPVRGMKLTSLDCSNTAVSSLLPLKGMPLTKLWCIGAQQVSDLSPLSGMPLTTVLCGVTGVSDLSPLGGCKGLKTLSVPRTKVTPASVASLQKALPNCKIEWDDPAKPKTPEPAASGTK
jgi:serine/threonine-protein kinase